MLTLAAALVLGADTPVVPSAGSSELAQVITAALAGLAALVTAYAGIAGLRRRRAAELTAAPGTVALDPEDTTARIRERLTALESASERLAGVDCGTRLAVHEERLNAHDRRLGDLDERMDLRRATDLAVEQALRPGTRRSAPRARKPKDPPP